ncbi:hypothetical protein TIFTF001_045295 [Ficus carica]|uniref:Cytochrome P450 n=1 Tax=Ficus carica TaxID=3494 RepID=A0AA88CWA7_FICCA|nr:hypothetical protein TIFTF001_045295 [Ficus carica]
MIKELINIHDIAVSNRPVSKASNIVFYGSKNMGFAPYGEYWKQARRITSQELLSPRRVQQFQFVREEVARLVERIRRYCRSGNSVNTSEMALATANNIVTRCVTGQSFADEDGRNKAAELVRKVMVQVTGKLAVGDVIPCLGWIDILAGFIDRLNSTFREMDSFLEKVIRDREELVKRSGEFDSKYFVDVLLRLQNDGECDCELPRDNIKAFLLSLRKNLRSGIPHRPSLAASSPWPTKYSCRHLTYSMKYLMSFRPANSIFNLLSCLNLWAHSVRTKSAQPPDKARVCKVPNSSGNFISLCDFTKGLVNLTLHDHGRSRSQLKHVASTITGGWYNTLLDLSYHVV